MIIPTILCREYFDVVLGAHDFDDFENGGQPEVYDIQEIIRVSIQCYAIFLSFFLFGQSKISMVLFCSTK